MMQEADTKQEGKPLILSQELGLLFLMLPIASAFAALETGVFFWKAGVAGGGIFVLCLFFCHSFARYKDVLWVMLAFGFSIGGDWFLSNKGENVLFFAAGIGLFFFAHLGYLGYALINGRLHRLATLLVLASYLLFFFFCLYPAIGSKLLLVSAFVYLLVSCVSFGASLGLQLPGASKWLYVFGIGMILLSDTMIAFHEFLHYKEWNQLILPTYYLAQISVTLSLLVRKGGSLREEGRERGEDADMTQDEYDRAG